MKKLLGILVMVLVFNNISSADIKITKISKINEFSAINHWGATRDFAVSWNVGAEPNCHFIK